MSDLPNSAIAVLSFYTADFQPLHDVTGPVKDAYCAKYGYRHIVKVAPYPADKGGWYYAFQRLRYLRDLLFKDEDGKRLPEGKDLEAVLVMNTHAQIMTHSITVQSLLQRGKDFYIAADVHGLNAGVFIVRRSAWLKRWLDFVLAHEHGHQDHSWKEQKIMMDHWKRWEFRRRIKIMDQTILNAYLHRHYDMPLTTPGEFQKGKSFCLHIPGRSVFHPEPVPLVYTRIALFAGREVQERILFQ